MVYVQGLCEFVRGIWRVIVISSSQGLKKMPPWACQEATNGHVHFKSLVSTPKTDRDMLINDCMGIERKMSIEILWEYIDTIMIEQQFPGVFMGISATFTDNV